GVDYTSIRPIRGVCGVILFVIARERRSWLTQFGTHKNFLLGVSSRGANFVLARSSRVGLGGAAANAMLLSPRYASRGTTRINPSTALYLIAASFFKSTRLIHCCNSFGSWFCSSI